jgi:integrase
MGSINRPQYKDRKGNYRESSVYWIQYFVGGKRERENTHSDSYEDAKNLLKRREGDVGSGRRTAASHGLLFGDLLDDEVVDYQVNHRRSIKDLEGRLKHVRPFLGECKPSSINAGEIARYVAKRKQGPGRYKGKTATNASVNRELTAIKRAFSLGIENGKISTMPKIRMLKESNARKGFFELKQFQSVRRYLANDLQPMITFAYVTGWRMRSEIWPLQWPQVDFKAGIVRLEPGTTKNDEARVFPFTDELRAVLELQKAKTDALRKEGIICPWVFHRKGQPIREFKRARITACRKAGLPGKIPHDFRRTAVRNLVRAGVPETVAMRMTGHKTRSVFDRYNITDEADLFDAARRLDGHDSQSLQPKTRKLEFLDSDKLLRK